MFGPGEGHDLVIVHVLDADLHRYALPFCSLIVHYYTGKSVECQRKIMEGGKTVCSMEVNYMDYYEEVAGADLAGIRTTFE